MRGQRANGSFAGLVNTTAFAVLALRAAGRPGATRAVRRGGALARRPGERATAASTSPAAAGRRESTTPAPRSRASPPPGCGGRASSAARPAGSSAHQNADGGFSLQGGSSNAQSTAWAVQGLIAAGRDPSRVRASGSRTPIAYLRSLVTPSGAIRYSRTSAQTPVWVTAQALVALAGKAFPLARRPARRAAGPRGRAMSSAHRCGVG